MLCAAMQSSGSRLTHECRSLKQLALAVSDPMSRPVSSLESTILRRTSPTTTREHSPLRIRPSSLFARRAATYANFRARSLDHGLRRIHCEADTHSSQVRDPLNLYSSVLAPARAAGSREASVTRVSEAQGFPDGTPNDNDGWM